MRLQDKYLTAPALHWEWVSKVLCVHDDIGNDWSGTGDWFSIFVVVAVAPIIVSSRKRSWRIPLSNEWISRKAFVCCTHCGRVGDDFARVPTPDAIFVICMCGSKTALEELCGMLLFKYWCTSTMKSRDGQQFGGIPGCVSSGTVSNLKELHA